MLKKFYALLISCFFLHANLLLAQRPALGTLKIEAVIIGCLGMIDGFLWWTIADASCQGPQCSQGELHCCSNETQQCSAIAPNYTKEYCTKDFPTCGAGNSWLCLSHQSPNETTYKKASHGLHCKDNSCGMVIFNALFASALSLAFITLTALHGLHWRNYYTQPGTTA